MTALGKYSMGIGDRFSMQGLNQIQAFTEARETGIDVTPVWNKSFREHQTVGSQPESVRKEADDAADLSGWEGSYFVDADHITMDTVDPFISSSDFFTLDVVNKLGFSPTDSQINDLFKRFEKYLGDITIEGFNRPFHISRDQFWEIASYYFLACEEARDLLNHIREHKASSFIIEVSMDEVEVAQTSEELYCILLFLAYNQVPLNTIAPKFIGRFNKGVDYHGDIDQFKNGFEEQILVIKHAIKHFGLPSDLKLSVHTGSDKFTLYPVINQLLLKHDVGLHLKTAGTTWLEELIGLAECGDKGLAVSKEIYKESLFRFTELTKPYSNVLDINTSYLPSFDEVLGWNGSRFAESIRHDKSNANYNPDMRQLLHTAYKIAAEKGGQFTMELERSCEIVGWNVKYNILENHIKPLFLT